MLALDKHQQILTVTSLSKLWLRSKLNFTKCRRNMPLCSDLFTGLVSYPAGAAAGYCILLVSSFLAYRCSRAGFSILLVSSSFPCWSIRQGLTSYSFLLSSLPCRRSRRVLYLTDLLDSKSDSSGNTSQTYISAMS